MTEIYKQALLKANEVREKLGLNIFEPINIFDACEQLDLTVRFVDISMEGLYLVQKDGRNPTILLSNQRPFPRRSYTCAHELGHHIFEHGFKIDALSESGSEGSNNAEEFLVDCFAGSLLMPIAGIQAEFAKRKWNIKNATPIDFFTVSSVFGTGYQTLITHCKANKLISHDKALLLSKTKPVDILKYIITAETRNSYFKIIDRQPKSALIDLEVTNYVILPTDVLIEGDHLHKIKETNWGNSYEAIRPGIIRIFSTDGKFNSVVRIQNNLYAGLAEYRYLENTKD